MTRATAGTVRPASFPTTPPFPPAPAPAAPDRRRWPTLAVLLAAAFLGTLDFFIINLALPSMQADLGASPAQVQLVIAGYGLAYAVCLITGGRLGDIFGRKRMFLVGVAGFTLSSALCGLAPTASFLVAARVFQGTAAAMLFPQVLSIIQVTFPPHERGRAFGAFGIVQGAASFSGIVLGGLLVEANVFGLGWRPIFLVNLPVGVLVLVAGGMLVHESRSPKARRLDLGGVAIVSAALFLLVYPLVQGREAGWPWWAFVCLAIAPLVLAVFVLFERQVLERGGAPLVELGLFRNRAFAVGLVTSMAFCCGLSAFFLTVTLFLQKGLDFRPTTASLTFAPFSAGYLIASLVAVRKGPRLTSLVINAGCALMAVAVGVLIVLARTRGALLSVGELMPVLLVYGIGQGLTFPTLISMTLSRVPPADAGSASGVLSTAQQVAFSMGVAVIGSVFFGSLSGGPSAVAYGVALGVALLCNGGLLMLTFVLALRLPRRATGEGVPSAPTEL
jgi:EmrB/QacA subfamily drug resistance transporter